MTKFCLPIEEGGRLSLVSDPAGTTDAVDVLVDGFGQIVVDYVFHAFDIQTAGGDGGSDQDWFGSSTKWKRN